MRGTTFTAIATAAATALLLAGCTAPASPGQDGHGPAATSEAGSVDPADIMFVQQMIPHHEQAVEMSDLLLAKDDIPAEVRELAEAITAAQEPEIELMRGWLEDWGVHESPGEGHGGGHGDGMMTDADLEALEAATGDTAARLFLEQMIEHHEGAVDMAESVLDQGSDPEVAALAQQIIETQTEEIAQMEQLLSRQP